MGEVVRPEMLELNQQPVSALAKDPETDTLRDGSRLNRVMITRIDPDKLTERYRANAADWGNRLFRNLHAHWLRCNQLEPQSNYVWLVRVTSLNLISMTAVKLSVDRRLGHLLCCHWKLSMES